MENEFVVEKLTEEDVKRIKITPEINKSGWTNILMEHTYSSYVCNFYLKLCSNKEKELLIESLNNYNKKKKNTLLNTNINNANINYDKY